VLIISWLLWFFKPGKTLDVVIIDKTVKTLSRDGHSSLVWILNHDKYINSKHKSYSLSKDYFGFYPLRPKNSGNFKIQHILLSDISEISDKGDILYFADMYGLYANEWYKNTNEKGPDTKIIGGITNSDYVLLKFMMDAGKTIIIESVFYCEPTEPLNRYRTEEALDIHPIGWSGKYFKSLDSTNKEIPRWIISTYEKTNDGKWPFKKGGIVFLKGNTQSVVLEEGKHLNMPMPQIETSGDMAARFNVPDHVSFTNWFELYSAGPNYKSISNFSLKVNSEGASILEMNGIPAKFPAIFLDKNEKIFFFTGDFSNHKIAYNTYWIPGWLSLNQKSFFHDESDSFLWNFYYPFMSNLFKEVQKNRKQESAKPN
jgi:hypothetical protein